MCVFPKPSLADSFRPAFRRAPKPPAGPDWVHEIKHDGYRLIVRRAGETVRLLLAEATVGPIDIRPSPAPQRSCGIPAREGLGAGFGWRVAFAFSGGEDPDPRRLQPLTRNLGWGWLAGLANHPGTVRDYFPQSPTSKVREWAFRQL